MGTTRTSFFPFFPTDEDEDDDEAEPVFFNHDRKSFRFLRCDDDT